MKKNIGMTILHYVIITGALVGFMYWMKQSWIYTPIWHVLYPLGIIALVDILFHKFVKGA